MMAAKSPPRSMSPTRSTGAFAIAATRMLARSRSFRFISTGLPAPSMTVRSCEAARRPNASSMTPKARSLNVSYRSGDIRPSGRPMTTTWQPALASGFGRIGFISTRGLTPAASACTACERPISPPSGVENEFRAIFCALNGATAYPSREKRRQRAVQRRLFPTLEAVPWIMSALAGISGDPPRRLARDRSGKQLGVEELRQQLETIDQTRARAAEIGGCVDRIDLSPLYSREI